MSRPLSLPALAHCIVLLLAATSAVAADSDSNADSVAVEEAGKRAAQLVGKLGDSSFSVRRKATRELLEIGLPALDALQQASQAEDLEVRYRAGRLFHEVRLKAHANRLEQYLTDPESISLDQLPGLKSYQEIAGTDEAARKLFVEMQRAEAELFVLLGNDHKKLKSNLDQRAVIVRYLLTTPEARKQIPATIAALMFLGTQPDVTISNHAVASIHGLANYREFRDAVSPKGSAFRKLVGHWIAAEKVGAAHQRLVLALRYDMKAGLGAALKTIKAPANNYELQYALFNIGRFGGPEHIPVVEAQFEKTDLLTAIGAAGKKPRFTAQVRDVALAVATHMLGKDPRKELGFPRLSENAQYLFNPNSAGFNDDSSRTAAFKKWDEWRAAEKKKSSNKPADNPKSDGK